MKTETVTCISCGGTGEVTFKNLTKETVVITCPSCKGTGKVEIVIKPEFI